MSIYRRDLLMSVMLFASPSIPDAVVRASALAIIAAVLLVMYRGTK